VGDSGDLYDAFHEGSLIGTTQSKMNEPYFSEAGKLK